MGVNALMGERERKQSRPGSREAIPPAYSLAFFATSKLASVPQAAQL
jgi:hypothetical protein